MSKSRGRAVTPDALLAEHGSDAVRYWAAGARPGVDTAFETRQMVIGRRLATKLLNASRFVLGLGEGEPDADTIEPLDAALLAALADVVRVATAALDDFDHARALAATETFFWTFCDDYLELVKDRAYGDGDGGAAAAGRVRAVLRIALSTLLRLFAPVLPFVTAEVWSWWRPAGMPESVHRAPWPTVAELDAAGAAAGDPAVLVAAGLAVRAVRRAKSQAKVSMRTPAALVVARGPESLLAAVRAGAADLIAAGRIERLEFDVDDSCAEVTVDVRL
jgi:valyl-tRNA synthetase